MSENRDSEKSSDVLNKGGYSLFRAARAFICECCIGALLDRASTLPAAARFLVARLGARRSGRILQVTRTLSDIPSASRL
jgi:hypothetical protein